MQSSLPALTANSSTFTPARLPQQDNPAANPVPVPPLLGNAPNRPALFPDQAQQSAEGAGGQKRSRSDDETSHAPAAKRQKQEDTGHVPVQQGLGNGRRASAAASKPTFKTTREGILAQRICEQVDLKDMFNLASANRDFNFGVRTQFLTETLSFAASFEDNELSHATQKHDSKQALAHLKTYSHHHLPVSGNKLFDKACDLLEKLDGQQDLTIHIDLGDFTPENESRIARLFSAYQEKGQAAQLRIALVVDQEEHDISGLCKLMVPENALHGNVKVTDFQLAGIPSKASRKFISGNPNLQSLLLKPAEEDDARTLDDYLGVVRDANQGLNRLTLSSFTLTSDWSPLYQLLEKKPTIRALRIEYAQDTEEDEPGMLNLSVARLIDSGLECLEIYNGQNMVPEVFAGVGKALANSGKLRKLVIMNSSITDSLDELTTGIAANRSLKSLDIKNCMFFEQDEISKEAFDQITEAVEVNPGMQVFRVDVCEGTDTNEEAKEFREAPPAPPSVAPDVGSASE
ncbi:MAG TPA: hypothetical protein VF797_18745 [Noviherbaspirillum sp.]